MLSLFVHVHFWDYNINTIFFLPFSPSKTSLYVTLISFNLNNCYCMHICVFKCIYCIQTLKQNLFCLYNVICIYVFKADFLQFLDMKAVSFPTVWTDVNLCFSCLSPLSANIIGVWYLASTSLILWKEDHQVCGRKQSDIPVVTHFLRKYYFL